MTNEEFCREFRGSLTHGQRLCFSFFAQKIQTVENDCPTAQLLLSINHPSKHFNYLEIFHIFFSSIVESRPGDLFLATSGIYFWIFLRVAFFPSVANLYESRTNDTHGEQHYIHNKTKQAKQRKEREKQIVERE